MRYRDHRGTLADSLETTVEIDATLDALAKHIGIAPDRLTVEPYVYDRRCGWQTYMVRSEQGLHGFTDAPIVEDDLLVRLYSLTNVQRREIFNLFCRNCGAIDPSCQCWNDE